MKCSLHNNSLQYQCVFDHIESIFSSHTVCVSHHDVCNRLIFFRSFQLGWVTSVSICLSFNSLNEFLIRSFFLVGTIFATVAHCSTLVCANSLSVIAFVHSVSLFEFLFTALWFVNLGMTFLFPMIHYKIWYGVTSKDFHFTPLFSASIAVSLLSTFSSTTKKTFPNTQMTNCWLVVSNSSSMSYFLLLLFPNFFFHFALQFSFSWSHFHSFSRDSNMQYCLYWYDRCLQQHAMLLMTDDHIGSS